MAEPILRLVCEEQVSLPLSDVDRLVENGSSDAALLYLCLAREKDGFHLEELLLILQWEKDRLLQAERVLRSLGLISYPSMANPSDVETRIKDQPCDENTIAQELEKNEEFADLLREVEKKLGPLRSSSVDKLLGMYKNLKLPKDVIFLLVSHCIEKKQEQFGTGCRLSMNEIEQEGYRWARKQLFSSSAANEYLKEERKKKQAYLSYMDVLHLGRRSPVPSEESYFSAWMEMGFPSESVAIAYDKTILNCQRLQWKYLNAILRRWHGKGLHSINEVRSEEVNHIPQAWKPGSNQNEWMRKYLGD